MEKMKKLIEKYRGYILDPEGNAVEIMEMLFVRENIQDFLESPDKITIMPPELHRMVMELEWFKSYKGNWGFSIRRKGSRDNSRYYPGRCHC